MFPGSPSIHSALTDNTPLLLLEELQFNKTHSNSHSLNAHLDPHSKTETLTGSETHSGVLVQFQQVSAVQAPNTERYKTGSHSPRSNRSLLVKGTRHLYISLSPVSGSQSTNLLSGAERGKLWPTGHIRPFEPFSPARKAFTKSLSIKTVHICQLFCYPLQ